MILGFWRLGLFCAEEWDFSRSFWPRIPWAQGREDTKKTEYRRRPAHGIRADKIGKPKYGRIIALLESSPLA